MSAVRTFLLYLSPVLVIGVCVGLFLKNEPLYSAIVLIAYLAFVFQVHKFKASKDGIEIEVDDEPKA